MQSTGRYKRKPWLGSEVFTHLGYLAIWRQDKPIDWAHVKKVITVQGVRGDRMVNNLVLSEPPGWWSGWGPIKTQRQLQYSHKRGKQPQGGDKTMSLRTSTPHVPVKSWFQVSSYLLPVLKNLALEFFLLSTPLRKCLFSRQCRAFFPFSARLFAGM